MPIIAPRIALSTRQEAARRLAGAEHGRLRQRRNGCEDIHDPRPPEEREARRRGRLARDERRRAGEAFDPADPDWGDDEDREFAPDHDIA